MGNDGGSIPRRIELVKEKQRVKKADKTDVAVAKWKHCQISQESLRPPIVACDLGRLYNKDTVIEHLLKKKNTAGAEHIKSLKDVTELHLTSASKTPLASNGVGTDNDHWVCPITGLEMTGLQRFSFIKTCGCVFSDRALKALKAVQSSCPSCNEPYTENNLIPINPPPEEEEALKSRLDVVKAQQKKEKEAKTAEKKKRSAEEAENPSASSDSVKKASNHKKDPSKAMKVSEKVKEIASKSIADDPNASKVFRSLFTTSADAKKKEGAHWVTHNPYYN